MPPSANPSEPGRKRKPRKAKDEAIGTPLLIALCHPRCRHKDEEYDEGVAGAAMSLVTPLIEILGHNSPPVQPANLKRQAYPNPFDAPVSSVILTFLLTLIKHPLALREDLAAFLTTIPKKYGPSKQGAIPSSTNTAERGKWITNGCTPPYRKTWCLRGMEWESRRVFERGYWKSDSITSELDVLAKGDHFETTDGKIEDDDGVYGEQIPADGQHHQSRHKSGESSRKGLGASVALSTASHGQMPPSPGKCRATCSSGENWIKRQNWKKRKK
ncbi:hypothetical protein M378DRAFT_1056679 [Amanita muscaria Koide BX008]|uniref:Uncharacterized protein n=1 Tax=Amanita muscaria (strain Koide BX008) TaxID=946122 RepID=A0A0C2WYK6_AMAMK|nr:hypothetical protein M378DRAFT_1056679 [Amanita muscaria Koide BX008]